jgi:hypothetical protein
MNSEHIDQEYYNKAQKSNPTSSDHPDYSTKPPLPVVRCPQLSRPEPVATIASCKLSSTIKKRNPLLLLPVASCQLSSTIKTRTRCCHCQLSVVRCPQLSRPEPFATIASCQLSVFLNYQDQNPLLPLPVVSCPLSSTIKTEPVAIIASCQLSVVFKYQDSSTRCYHCELSVVRCSQISS